MNLLESILLTPRKLDLLYLTYKVMLMVETAVTTAAKITLSGEYIEQIVETQYDSAIVNIANPIIFYGYLSHISFLHTKCKYIYIE